MLVATSLEHLVFGAVLRDATNVGALEARVLEGAVVLVLTAPRHPVATSLQSTIT